MSTPKTIKTQLRLLLNNANETTGNQDTTLTDGVNALVSGYGQGGSGGSSGGASMQIYADYLYEFYGVDVKTYPYLYIYAYYTDFVFICFARTLNDSTLQNIKTGSATFQIKDYSDIPTVVENITLNITTLTTADHLSQEMYDNSDTYGTYTNFEYTFVYTPHYKLYDSDVSGSLVGLENGYDVMFYDENNEGLAFYSIKQGHSINPPVYNCKAWKTSDGANVNFPYTPSADLILYANNDTYASQLYNFYGVDSGVYPYLLIAHAGTNASASGIRVNIYFAKNASFESTYIYFTDCLTETKAGEWSDDVDTFISQVMERISSVISASTSIVYFRTSEQEYSAKAYLNFDVSYTQRTLYRLDE